MTHSQLPEEVQRFVEAVKENARQAFDHDLADQILHVEHKDDGRIVMCDNFERFFDLIWTYHPDGQWTTRRMYGEGGEQPYSFKRAMADASILLTG